MQETVLLSLPLPQLQTLIIDAVNACLDRREQEQPQPDTERWLNLSELCEYLPDKPVKPTVYGWVHQRVIPCHKRGRALYFLKSEIDVWLKAGRKKTIAETASDAETYLRNKKKGGCHE